ncbi:MAG: hypothetical protein FWF51_07925, partial [Chitinivibrionia bacterium]|nr:hypothetical protein [Chitinivibrionia bacterium]
LNFLFLTKFLVACFLAFCAFGFVACSDDDDGPSVDSKVVGTWIAQDGDEVIELKLNSNGTWEADGGKGTFSTSGDKVTINYPDGTSETASYRVEGNKLIMSTTYNGQTYEMVYTKK